MTPFVLPPYPHDRLHTLRRLADALPGGLVDLSIANPVDPVPKVVADAAAVAISNSAGYPESATGSNEFRSAVAAWMQRRFGVTVSADAVVGCVGTKEFVASLPRALYLRDPGRDTVLYPSVSYPTYAMGAQLAGLRSVPIPLDDEWHIDLVRISDADAERSLVMWINYPSNPTAAVADLERLQKLVNWANERGIVVASDECYSDFLDGDQAPSALQVNQKNVLSVYSLSKRSNAAGFRVGFTAGDPELVQYFTEFRRHAGLMIPTVSQALAVAALADDEHVSVQRDRYRTRREKVLGALDSFGLTHDGGPMLFYLWLRDTSGTDDGWEVAANLAESGILVAPGDLYGALGADHVRMAMTISDERLDLALQRLSSAHERR